MTDKRGIEQKGKNCEWLLRNIDENVHDRSYILEKAAAEDDHVYETQFDQTHIGILGTHVTHNELAVGAEVGEVPQDPFVQHRQYLLSQYHPHDQQQEQEQQEQVQHELVQGQEQQQEQHSLRQKEEEQNHHHRFHQEQLQHHQHDKEDEEEEEIKEKEKEKEEKDEQQHKHQNMLEGQMPQPFPQPQPELQHETSQQDGQYHERQFPRSHRQQAEMHLHALQRHHTTTETDTTPHISTSADLEIGNDFNEHIVPDPAPENESREGKIRRMARFRMRKFRARNAVRAKEQTKRAVIKHRMKKRQQKEDMRYNIGGETATMGHFSSAEIDTPMLSHGDIPMEVTIEEAQEGIGLMPIGHSMINMDDERTNIVITRVPTEVGVNNNDV